MEKELINLIIIIGLILLNAYFVLLEFAIVQIRSSQIDALIQNNKRAKKCKIVKDNLNTYLSSTQFDWIVVIDENLESGIGVLATKNEIIDKFLS